ncbi:MAG: glutamate racemase [Spirochaetales bacterium]|jgi:glutamate racemase|nr:glutamate racemase [Spirochaetales bacterium]
MDAACRPIIFIDSGIGGLPYLEQTRKTLPKENYIYVADTTAFPYGEKSQEDLKKIVVERVSILIERFLPKTLVVACNTASVVALSTLRSHFDIPFVGVVPAVKPAAASSQKGRIGLLATNGTVSDSYTDKLIKDFASSCVVTRIGNAGIVDFVEHRFIDSTEQERAAALAPVVTLMKSSDIDTLVIGCTHFIFIEEELSRQLNGAVKIIDSRDGVCRQIVRKVQKEGVSGCNENKARFYITGKANSMRYSKISSQFDMTFAGSLDL